MSNYTMNTVKNGALDKGHGVLIASADSKPRILLGASCYAVTNTTNVVPVLAMCPATTLDASQSIDTNTQPVVYLQRSSQPLNGALATPYTPACLVPYTDSRAGGGQFPIIPPGWMLFGCMGDVDGNGDISWQVCTADCEW